MNRVLCYIMFFLSVFGSPAYAEKVGFFSGTFDPPHLGHKETLEQAIASLGLDVVYVIPNYKADHKPQATSYELRLQMLKSLVQEHPQVELPDAELEQVLVKNGVNGVIDRVENRHPEASIYLIMGQDAVSRYEEYLSIVLNEGTHVVVSSRSSSHEEIPSEILRHNGFHLLPEPKWKISSTKIRAGLGGVDIPAGLSDGVYEVIRASRLYGLGQPRVCGEFLESDSSISRKGSKENER